jgi:hypothetical protein
VDRKLVGFRIECRRALLREAEPLFAEDARAKERLEDGQVELLNKKK